MKLTYEKCFWNNENDEKSSVFQIFPEIYGDKRGDFCEVLKDMGKWGEGCEYPLWFSNLQWMRQVNRSKNDSGVVRGCHAQKGIFCQGKLVEAVNRRIYDVITDARPDSETFGCSNIYLLDPERQNKLWVPRGFLHAFAVPFEHDTEKAVFNYYVDNVYDRKSEICVNPKTLIPKAVEIQKSVSHTKDFEPLYEMFSAEKLDSIVYSEKDLSGVDYETFMKETMESYENGGKPWYE